MAEPTHYELLGVFPSADQAEIKSAFRDQAKRNHPDQGGNAALFRLVEEAYDVLSDPVKRAAYDRRTSNASAGSGGGFNDTTAYSYDDSFVEEEQRPTGEWTYADWHTNDWTGDEASAWTDREPAPEPAPTYVAQPTNLGKWAEVLAFTLIAIPWAARAFVIWAIVALILGRTIVPFVDNKHVLIGIAALVGLWIWGPFLLRWLGIAAFVFGVWQTQYEDTGLLITGGLLVGGFVLWMLGHWFLAFKSGKHKSVAAVALFRLFPERAHPMRRWRKDAGDSIYI